MTSPKELLTFPLLPFTDRLRLGRFAARCQLTKTHDDLDTIPLLEWLRRTSGRRAVERLWEPLLDSKFDGRYDDTRPPTSGRDLAACQRRGTVRREVMGWPAGGYQRLIDVWSNCIVALGGEVRPHTSVDQIVGTRTGTTGVVVDGSLSRVRLRPLHAPPPGPSIALARSGRTGTGRPLPLSRRDLPAAPSLGGASARITT